MPRIVEIAVPSERTSSIVDEIQKIDGLIGLRVQNGISIKPKGDVISLEVTNKDLSTLMQLFSKQTMLSDPQVSITISEPKGVISKSSEEKVTTDISEAVWEEMQATINSQSAMTVNSLLVMFLAGVIAVIGILTNALHVVVGAMVLAPGFEPVTRISLGIVSQYLDWKNGLIDTLKAYIALLLGAVVTAWIMDLMGHDLTSGNPTYLPKGVLIQYWTTITTTSVIVTIAAAVVGALVIVTNRSVLTAGVMIALALVPATAISGIGMVAGQWDVAGKGFLRLLMEVSIIGCFTAVIFLWKKHSVQRRKMYG